MRALLGLMTACAMVLMGALPDARAQITYRASATAASQLPQYRSSATAAGVPNPLYRASTTGATTGATLTINRPAGVVANDILIASVGVQPSAAVLTPPAGWVLIRRTDNAGPTSNSLAVYRKLATGAEPASYSWTVAGGSYTVGGLQAYYNIDTAAPVDVEAGQTTPSNTTHATPGVTTTVARAFVVASHTYASSRNWTPPTGMTESFDRRSGGAAGPTGQSIEGSRVLQAAAGATGAKTATAAADADAGVTHILALRPSATAQVLTIARPAGAVANDVFIASVGFTPSSATITPPAGWTLIRRVDNAGPTSNSLAVYRKTMAGGEPASYSWSLTGVNYVVGGIQAFNGVDTTTPIDAEAGQATASDRDHATPSITTTVANTMLVGSYTYASSQSWDPRTPPSPAMTESYEQLSGAAGATGQSIEGTSLLQAAAGVVPAYTSRAGNPPNADAGVTHILALRPVSSNLTITRPGTVVANDVMIASVGVTPSSATITPPAGWTSIRRINNAGPTSNSLEVFYRVAGAGEPASYTWSLSGANYGVAGLQAFYNVDTATPIDAEAGQATPSSRDHATPAITTTVANTMLVGSYTYASAQTWAPQNPPGPPVAMTESYDRFGGTSGPTGQSIEGTRQAKATAGAVPAFTSRAGSVANADAGNTHMLALRPSVVVPPPSSFNAFEQPAGFTCATMPITTTNGPIRTKIVGSGYSLCVVALDSLPQILAAFNADVRVEVLARTTVGPLGTDGCPRTNVGDPPVTVLSNVSPVTLASGRASVAFPAAANAWRDVRVRISYPTSSPTVTRCSTDNYAIRPLALSVSSTTAGADSTGTDVSATPTVKAGTNFSLAATSLASYNGTPQIDAALRSAHAGAVQSGDIAGSFSAADPATGIATGAGFTYSEVGYFRFLPYGVYDSGFTAVDQPAGCRTADTCECIAATGDSNSDSIPDNFSNVAIGGRYGCNFGNTSNSDFFGRFIPDHFGLATLAANSLIDRADINTGASETCTSSFTYMGEDFKTRFELSARNAADAITLNYTGGHARFGLTTWSDYAFAGSSGTLAAGSTAPSGTWSNGVATVTATHIVQRSATTPAAPYAGFAVSAQPSYSDGSLTVALAASTQVHAGTTEMRYGRLRLANAYGSELRALPVPVRAEHWNGTGFVTNTEDSCTVVGAVTLNAAPTPCTLAPAIIGAGGTLASGAGLLTLSAPGVRGCTDLILTAPAWLQGRWSGATYTENPKARATFGIFKEKVLFRRENFN